MTPFECAVLLHRSIEHHRRSPVEARATGFCPTDVPCLFNRDRGRISRGRSKVVSTANGQATHRASLLRQFMCP